MNDETSNSSNSKTDSRKYHNSRTKATYSDYDDTLDFKRTADNLSETGVFTSLSGNHNNLSPHSNYQHLSYMNVRIREIPVQDSYRTI